MCSAKPASSKGLEKKSKGSQKLRVVKHTETAEQRIALISGIIADFAKESR